MIIPIMILLVFHKNRSNEFKKKKLQKYVDLYRYLFNMFYNYILSINSVKDAIMCCTLIIYLH